MRRRDFLQSALALGASGLINPGRLPAVVNQTEQIGQTDAFHTALAEQPWLLGFETAAAQSFDTPRLTIEGSNPASASGHVLPERSGQTRRWYCALSALV